MSHLKCSVNNGDPHFHWNSIAWAMSTKNVSNMSGYTMSVTVFSAKKKCTNTFVLGVEAKHVLTCTSKHCERIFAYRNSTVMSVNVFGQALSGFGTKHNLGCKTFVWGLHLKNDTEIFVAELLSWSVTTFWETNKFQIISQNYLHCRLWFDRLSFTNANRLIAQVLVITLVDGHFLCWFLVKLRWSLL